MTTGILQVSETVTSEIDAVRAFVIVTVTSEQIIFGNAALKGSEELKRVVDQIKHIDEAMEIETEAISIETNSGIFGKNSTADYTIKLTINDLEKLGLILGVCSETKKLTLTSIHWGYEDEKEKLVLIKKAIRQAKEKADEMMKEIGHNVIGIRACSDSYTVPEVSEVTLSGYGDSGADDTLPFNRTRRVYPPSEIDIGTQFKRKKEISATFTVEFVIEKKPDFSVADQNELVEPE